MINTSCKNKWSANANGNAQQSRCMFERPVKQSLSQSPEGARRTSAIVSIVFYLYSPKVATYRSANTISARYRRFDLAPSHLGPSFGLTLFEFVEKLYCSWNYRVFRAADGGNLVILACTVFDWSTRVTDRQTELRWLKHATAVAAVARKK